MSKSSRTYKYIKKIEYIDYKHLDDISSNFDWIIACPVETSIGYKIPIEQLFKLKKNLNQSWYLTLQLH